MLARKLGAATSTPSRALPLGPNFDLGTRGSVTGATQAELLTNQLGWFHMIEKSNEYMLPFCIGSNLAETGSSMA